MTISLDNAVVYDIESFPNAFTLVAESLNGDARAIFEISPWRNDMQQLIEWLDYLGAAQIPMIGYNNINYDYPMLHHIRTNPHIDAAGIRAKNDQIINSSDRFGHIIWERDRLIPQIDLMLLHHYDNPAKRTSLKFLQVNMRSNNVMESKIPFDAVLTEEQLRQDVIPYNIHDVTETKRFAHYSRSMIDFRVRMIPEYGVDVLNWNDTKFGEQMLIKRLGDDVCFDRSSGRKVKRQTVRTYLPVKDMIFPYVRFEHPEFNRVLAHFQSVTLTPADMKKDDTGDHVSPLSISANIGGITFKFGSGGVHASVERQRFVADDVWCVRDVDVAGMYPDLSNKNRLAPEHLGEPFIAVYAELPEERAQYPKGTPENLMFKLGGNAAWGKSKSPYSCFYDAKYALTVPINGQLLICMLVDQLLKVPTLRIIQANTDGVTYYVQRAYLQQCEAIEEWWERYTLMTLEHVMYKRMFVRDVNNYLCESESGKRKLKGAYWSPGNFQEALDAQSAHKNYNPTVVQRAAVAAMFDGIDPMMFLRTHVDPFDFMIAVKVNRGAQLYWGDEPIQSTTRYYVSTGGRQMSKVSPPPAGFSVGMWKKASGVSNAEYYSVMAETGGAWDARVCTKNQSRYEDRRTMIEAGWKTQECNDVRNFRFDNINYDWYMGEVNKLII